MASSLKKYTLGKQYLATFVLKDTKSYEILIVKQYDKDYVNYIFNALKWIDYFRYSQKQIYRIDKVGKIKFTDWNAKVLILYNYSEGQHIINNQ